MKLVVAVFNAAVLLLAVQGYSWWGTGLEYADGQQQLTEQLGEDLSSEVLMAAENMVAGSTGDTDTKNVSAVEAGQIPDWVTDPDIQMKPAKKYKLPTDIAYEEGDPVFQLYLPTILEDDGLVVQAGVSVRQLRNGPGHYPGTVLPGQVGNAAIAGHRTTYGAPFQELDELEEGDPIVAVTPDGVFMYRVSGATIVSPKENWVLGGSPNEATLTLTTCHPEKSTRQRLIVFADLDDGNSDSLTEPGVYRLASKGEPTSDSPETSQDDTNTVTAPTVPDPTVSTVPGDTTADTVAGDNDGRNPQYSEEWFDQPELYYTAILGLFFWLAGIGTVSYATKMLRNNRVTESGPMVGFRWKAAYAIGIIIWLIGLFYAAKGISANLPVA